jgi:hypothetical protein
MTVAQRNVLAASVIVVLLAALFLPSLQIRGGEGRRANCQNNLRQITQAGIICNEASGYLPASRSWASKMLGEKNAFPAEFPEDPEKFAYTWVQPILPYLGSADIAYELANLPEEAQSSYGVRIPLLMCTSDMHAGEGPAALDYAINAGRANCDSVWQNHDWAANGGSFDALRQQQDLAAYRRSRLTLPLPDGASNTIAFAENVYLRTWCLDPTADPPVTSITEFHSGIVWHPRVPSLPQLPAFDDSANDRGGVSLGSAYAHPSSRHPGGFGLALWDGSTRFVNNNIDYTVYARLMSSDGRRTQDPCDEEFAGPTPTWQATPLTASDY